MTYLIFSQANTLKLLFVVQDIISTFVLGILFMIKIWTLLNSLWKYIFTLAPFLYLRFTGAFDTPLYLFWAQARILTSKQLYLKIRMVIPMEFIFTDTQQF